ncbi:DUF1566 domain-containing protein [Paracandidimonas soli]|uniref:DUF1566 domain-containing protein n=1 Tax=Paracandidimonas soli TaxID=1917182 RepID=A0A4R3V184_9BURK|nr:DUF1566 domain-containing protein [Paracandidimonas soli]TCU97300.1 hypothetical protein EV686_106183 [Paracandidimonas soli]
MQTPQIYLPGQAVPELEGTSAGIMRGDDGTRYVLVVPNDPATDTDVSEWGCYGKSINGASSRWDGLLNTQELVASDSDLDVLELISKLNAGNESAPFYLPSQRELALCWATVPHLFQTDDWYWSSTQYSAHSAWFQSFLNGLQVINYKSYAGRVRAVRRLIIQ